METKQKRNFNKKIKSLISFLLVLCITANTGLSSLPGVLPVLADVPGIVEIRTAEQFNNIRNNLDGSYRLMNNIDLNGMEWLPIGTNYAPFTGMLDGNGFAVLNMEITAPMRDLVGLFGRNDGVIANLGLVSANINGGFTVGGIAGTNRGEIHNSYVTGLSTVFGEGFVPGFPNFYSVVQSAMSK